MVGARAVIATRASGHLAVGERDDGCRADDRDLHLAAVLEPDVRTPGSRRGVGDVDRDEQLVARGDGRARPREELVDGHGPCSGGRAQRRRRPEAHQRAAGLHRGGGVHEIPADRPVRPRRVRPDDRARVGEGGEAGAHVRVCGDLGMCHEGAETQGVRVPVDPTELGDAVDRDERVG